jgi:hypothetical protein
LEEDETLSSDTDFDPEEALQCDPVAMFALLIGLLH